MKNKNESILPSCALCIYATLLPKDEETEKPPLLFSLSADGMGGDVQIQCPYHESAEPAFACRRFSFDPLKYRPTKAPRIAPLDTDTLFLD